MNIGMVVYKRQKHFENLSTLIVIMCKNLVKTVGITRRNRLTGQICSVASNHVYFVDASTGLKFLKCYSVQRSVLWRSDEKRISIYNTIPFDIRTKAMKICNSNELLCIPVARDFINCLQLIWLNMMNINCCVSCPLWIELLQILVMVSRCVCRDIEVYAKVCKGITVKEYIGSTLINSEVLKKIWDACPSGVIQNNSTFQLDFKMQFIALWLICHEYRQCIACFYFTSSKMYFQRIFQMSITSKEAKALPSRIGTTFMELASWQWLRIFGNIQKWRFRRNYDLLAFEVLLTMDREDMQEAASNRRRRKIWFRRSGK